MHRTARRAARFRLRAACVVACLAAFPLYATEEAVSRLLARPWCLPGRLVDRVDRWLSDLEDRIDAAGDSRFGARLGAVTDRAATAVDTALTHITGRA